MIVGVASVWTERKGLSTFIKLSAKLNEDYQIVLVGITEKQKNDLPVNIIGITRTNNIKELAEIYTTADVFVNPTLEDNFPTVNLEALACGTPVITYDTGGSPEIVNIECGVVVRQDDLDELILKIIKLTKCKNVTTICLKEVKKYNKYQKFLEYFYIYQESVSGEN